MTNRNQQDLVDRAMLALDQAPSTYVAPSPFAVHKHNERWWFFDDKCERIGPFDSSLEAGGELHKFQQYLKTKE